MSEEVVLTNKQIKLIVKILLGSVAWNLPFDFSILTEIELEKFEKEKRLLAIKLLGEHPSFGEGDEIVQYVKQIK